MPNPTKSNPKSSQIQPKSNQNRIKIESKSNQNQILGNPCRNPNTILGNPSTIIGNPKKSLNPMEILTEILETMTSFVVPSSFVPSSFVPRAPRATLGAGSHWEHWAQEPQDSVAAEPTEVLLEARHYGSPRT